MKKITVFIENNKKDLYLDVSINKPGGSVMILKNATVYWRCKNVITGDNDYVMYGTKKITFEEGYWTFEMMKEKLGKEKIKLVDNKYNNTCKIYSDVKDLNLKKFATLIGFPEDETISGGTWETSPNTVDVNRGFRYVNVSCDIVDASENYDTGGGRSQTLVSLPIPSDQSLNGTASFFRNIDSKVTVNSGCFNRLTFDVSTNIDKKVDMDLLLELYIT